jgi:hypothetical protein
VSVERTILGVAADLTDRIRAHLISSSEWTDWHDDADDLDGLLRAISDAPRSERSEFADSLVDLLLDPDLELVTAATAALRDLRKEPIGPAVHAALSLRPELLSATPVRYDLDRPTIGAELLVLLGDMVTATDAELLAACESGLVDPDVHGDLLAALARTVPDIVCERAATWATTDDTAALLWLPTRRHRVLLATTLAPWPAVAHDVVRRAASWGRLPPEELDELLAAMGA